jgi:hypothetical protein
VADINIQKEFYFIRHGQTDHHYDDSNISLNSTGISQAYNTKKILSKIELKSVCYSPLKSDVSSFWSDVHLSGVQVVYLGVLEQLLVFQSQQLFD